MSDDGKIVPLFPKAGESAAMDRWEAKLTPYLNERSMIESLRHQPMPAPPWPDRDNPMLGYLIDRGREIVENEGAESAIVWLAVHGWFEGSLEERFRVVSGLLPDDG